MVQVDQTSLNSFGMKAEPPALSGRDDVLVDKDAAASKPCLSPVEMHTLTAAGDLLPAGNATTATRIIFYQPPLWFCPIEEIKSGITIQYAMHYSSFWKMGILETKSRQTLVLGPDGSINHLCACPVLRR